VPSRTHLMKVLMQAVINGRALDEPKPPPPGRRNRGTTRPAWSLIPGLGKMT